MPLLTGGGSPLKFVEALAYGLPVVATPHAAAGLEAARAGEHYREADGPEAFADALAERPASTARRTLRAEEGRSRSRTTRSRRSLVSSPLNPPLEVAS